MRESLSGQLADRAHEIQDSATRDVTAIGKRVDDIQVDLDSRIRDIRDAIVPNVKAEINEGFRQLEVRMEELRLEIDRGGAAVEQKVAEADRVITERTGRLDRLLKEHPWLGVESSIRPAYEVEQLQSVEQAHALATKLFEEDSMLARRALEQIIERDLPGSDNDYHNAYVQAMRQEEVALAVQIIEQGAIKHPLAVDVVADRLQALTNVGRAAEAKKAFETWAAKSGGAHLRGWRPMAFYLNATAQVDVSSAEQLQIETRVRDALANRPHEQKLWGNLVTWLRRQGRLEDAVKTAEDGLKHNPYSQQLHYSLGEILLQMGRATEAVDALEKALAVDFQEQYQHDVNQVSVWLTLAQAYEAVGRSEDALRLYDGIPALRGDQLLGVGIRFASSRRAAILARRGEVPEAGGAAATSASAGQAIAELVEVTVRAAKGDAAARKQVEEMFLPLLKAQDNLRDLAGRIVRILGGDRDVEILVKGLDAHDTSVVKAILKRLS